MYKQRESQTATKAEYISDVGSMRGILKLLGVKLGHLTPKDCAPLSKYICKRQIDKRE